MPTLEAGKALAGTTAWLAEARAALSTESRPERSAHGRPQFRSAERAVAVFVEREQRVRGGGDLVGVEHAVAVAVEGVAERVAGWAEGSAGEATGARVARSALTGATAETAAAALLCTVALSAAFLTPAAILVAFATAFSGSVARRRVAFGGLRESCRAEQEQAG